MNGRQSVVPWLYVEKKPKGATSITVTTKISENSLNIIFAICQYLQIGRRNSKISNPGHSWPCICFQSHEKGHYGSHRDTNKQSNVPDCDNSINKTNKRSKHFYSANEESLCLVQATRTKIPVACKKTSEYAEKGYIWSECTDQYHLLHPKDTEHLLIPSGSLFHDDSISLTLSTSIKRYVCYRRGDAYLMCLLQFSAIVLICSLNMVYVNSTLATLPMPLLSSSSTVSTSSYVNYQRIPMENDRWPNKLNDANKQNLGGHFTHTWAVHIPNGDENETANLVAKDHGFINIGKVCKILYILCLFIFFSPSLSISHGYNFCTFSLHVMPLGVDIAKRLSILFDPIPSKLIDISFQNKIKIIYLLIKSLYILHNIIIIISYIEIKDKCGTKICIRYSIRL